MTNLSHTEKDVAEIAAKRPYVKQRETGLRIHNRMADWTICQQCKTPYLASVCEIKRGRSRFCSRPCHSKHNTEARWARERHEWEQRFWPKIDKSDDPAACWLWNSWIGKNGYGRFKLKLRGVVAAHRLVLELTTGESGNGLMCLHSCDTPLCCNPAHLRWGTAADNAQDMMSRGRNRFGPNAPHRSEAA